MENMEEKLLAHRAHGDGMVFRKNQIKSSMPSMGWEFFSMASMVCFCHGCLAFRQDGGEARMISEERERPAVGGDKRVAAQALLGGAGQECECAIMLAHQ